MYGNFGYWSQFTAEDSDDNDNNRRPFTNSEATRLESFLTSPLHANEFTRAGQRLALLMFHIAGLVPSASASDSGSPMTSGTTSLDNSVNNGSTTSNLSHLICSDSSQTQEGPLITVQPTISKSAHILDVGFGCGDQVYLLAEMHRFTLPIVGVNYSQEQVDLANTRLDAIIKHYDPITRQLQRPLLLTGSGTKLVEDSHLSTYLAEQSSPRKIFTHVLSLDTAYHFETRKDFFHQAATLLHEEGVLCVTDIVLPSPTCPTCSALLTFIHHCPTEPSLSELLRWSAPGSGSWIGSCLLAGHHHALLLLISPLFSIPRVNLKTQELYEQDLVSTGFTQTSFSFIDRHVFYPFTAFIEKHCAMLRSFVNPLKLIKFYVTSYALKKVSVSPRNPSPWIQYAVIRAERATTS